MRARLLLRRRRRRLGDLGRDRFGDISVLHQDREEGLGVDRRGGVIPCIEEGFFQRELARSAYRYQQELEAKERIVVGVNEFVMANEVIDIPVLKIDRTVEPKQIAALQKLKARRDNGAVQVSLDRLGKAAAGSGNTFDAMMDCARCYATVGEMCDVLRATWGEWSESAQAMQVS